MIRVRPTTLGLGFLFLAMLSLLLLARADLLAAHLDGTIEYLSSDAATYFSLYENLYEQLDLSESPALFLIGSPILFMKLSDGNLLPIQALNLALMVVTLKVAFDCLPGQRSRLQLLACALIFPYFLLGFLSLNKEVYAMCSAILYATYMASGRRSHLLAALVLAACARYYMLAALVTLLVLVPRDRSPRYGLIVALLLAISVAAPLVKRLVPEYSSENLLEDSGAAGVFFSSVIDSFGYVVAYPLKYLVLVPMRAYSLLLGSGRTTDPMEAVVSIASLAALLLAVGILARRKSRDTVAGRLVIAGLVAPIPIMWSEIMHWRYYSFVYFFFVFAIVLAAEDRRRQRAMGRNVVHA